MSGNQELNIPEQILELTKGLAETSGQLKEAVANLSDSNKQINGKLDDVLTVQVPKIDANTKVINDHLCNHKEKKVDKNTNTFKTIKIITVVIAFTAVLTTIFFNSKTVKNVIVKRVVAELQAAELKPGN